MSTLLSCSGDKIGDVNDDIGNYFATKTITFDEVTTTSIKIVLKDGYLGEPSFYEIQPLFFESVIDAEGSSAELEELSALAETIDKTAKSYQALDETLRTAFEESMLDAKEAFGKNQAEIDSVKVFLKNRYQRIIEALEKLPEVCEVFPDVEHGTWYEAGVQYVYDKGIMSGSNGLFNPTGNITRAQVVATLYKLEGSPEVTDFKAVNELVDVEAGQWYTNAVCWAYNTGVTTGNKTTKMFNMSSPVTRQQLASFFYSYAELKGLDTETRSDISGMAGADQVADYALDTMQWAVGTGLITGSETTVNGVTVYDLKPTGTATRAQMASILMRFCEGN